MRKEHLQISHPAKVYIFIRYCNAIFFRMFPNVRIYQGLQIMSGIFQGISNYIGANSIAVVGITGLIIAAFVFRMCIHIIQCAVQDVCLVVHTVTVCVCSAVQLRDLSRKSILQSDSRRVLITA